VPAEQSEAIKGAQNAWRHFQAIGTEISAGNRARLLQGLKREKQLARSKRTQARRKP